VQLGEIAQFPGSLEKGIKAFHLQYRLMPHFWPERGGGTNSRKRIKPVTATPFPAPSGSR
jgi:hypothetical protein